MWADALVIFGAYLLGAFPVVYLLGRTRGFDLSKEEDMHISLWRKVGRLEGLIGITWDVVKGAIAVVVVRVFSDFGWGTVAGVGVAVVVGLMWSMFLKFRGEKANTTSLGVSAALAYQALPFLLVPIALGAGIRTAPRFFGSKQPLNERLKFGGPPSLSLPLGMFFGFALFPLGCWYMNQPWETTLAGVIIFLLIVIKRLTAGLREEEAVIIGYERKLEECKREGIDTSDLEKRLKTATSKKSILLNRALYDRSYR